jgi:hypothetical protein
MSEVLAEQGRALAAEVSELLPGFRPRPRTLRRTLKSLVIAGDSDSGPVLCKKLVHADPLWRWYFARELELCRRFTEEPPPLRVARLIASDPARALLIVEELPGPPLARLRRAAALDAALLAPVVDLCLRLGAWERGLALAPAAPPPAAARHAMRARLLEDPSAPVTWVCDGIERGVALGLCDAELAAAMLAAIEAHPRTAFAHGDLLPRNLLRVDGGLAPVDWECAGSHLEGWDRALLWANLPAARARLEATVTGDGAARAAFWACAGFSLVRELKFRRARPGAPRTAELRAELERVRRELRARP